jgi:extradiol dioxygenase family protein
VGDCSEGLSPIEPILHLSLPVRDLDAAREFYVDVLGCRPGQEGPGGMDVWFYGLQLTLQLRPEQLLPDGGQGDRHFGVTLERADFDQLIARLQSQPIEWVTPVTSDVTGALRAKAGGKLADPSGNVIEFETYDDPRAALG